MHPTISQMFYPNRQAFFAKLSVSLPLQPAITIGPAPLPGGEHRPGPHKYAEGSANGDAVQRATKHEGEDQREPQRS